MAKVNTKFIIILSGGILGAVGLAVLAMKLVFKSPAELAATASDFAAQGEYAAAAAGDRDGALRLLRAAQEQGKADAAVERLVAALAAGK